MGNHADKDLERLTGPDDEQNPCVEYIGGGRTCGMIPTRVVDTGVYGMRSLCPQHAGEWTWKGRSSRARLDPLLGKPVRTLEVPLLGPSKGLNYGSRRESVCADAPGPCNHMPPHMDLD